MRVMAPENNAGTASQRAGLAIAARQLLSENTETGIFEGQTYTFTVPSLVENAYPFQWFWDSCFHTIVWASLDIERAKEEMRSLLTAQQKDGFIPHTIFWNPDRMIRAPWMWHWQESRGRLSCLPGFPKPRTTALMQPPLLAQAVEHILRVDPDKHFLSEILPKLNRYYAWLFKVRDPDRDFLITITSAYESGLDWGPAYDPVIGFKPGRGFRELWLRGRARTIFNKILFNFNERPMLAHGPFHVEDVLVNSILALNLDILGKLNRMKGNEILGTYWEDTARRLTDALIAKCWDKERGAFFNLDGREERRNTVLGIQSLMPLIIPWLSRRYVAVLVERHLLNPEEFWLPYPVPSVAKSEPAFTPTSLVTTCRHEFTWRGSTWMNLNWFLIQALRVHGYSKEADVLAEKSKRLVLRGGFREFFNPLTGEGLGAKNFGWSTLASVL